MDEARIHEEVALLLPPANTEPRLNRTYYANRVLTQGPFQGEEETYASGEREDYILSETSKANTVAVRVDRIMVYEHERDTWEEQLRVCYRYDTDSRTWKFAALYEGHNKIR